MSDVTDKLSSQSIWIDHIPATWVEPVARSQPRCLIIFLPHFTGSKEQVSAFLKELAADGFVALSFDPWQHGERGTETREEMTARVFGAFRRHMWPILGQTTLDTLRVVDWAVSALGVEPDVRIGGLSMGGDIAVAAAGLDHRIKRVTAVVSTPDWLRPGMHDAFNPSQLLDQGNADAYAQYFYDQLNPSTHLGRYSHVPAINFYCGEKDTHVPAALAFNFQTALRRKYPEKSANVSIDLIPDLTHLDVRDPSRWWPECFHSLTAS